MALLASEMLILWLSHHPSDFSSAAARHHDPHLAFLPRVAFSPPLSVFCYSCEALAETNNKGKKKPGKGIVARRAWAGHQSLVCEAKEEWGAWPEISQTPCCLTLPKGEERGESEKREKRRGREGGGRENIFWMCIQKSRTFITKFEVRPGNLNCYQLRVSPSASRSLVFQGPRTILRSNLEEISKETKY